MIDDFNNLSAGNVLKCILSQPNGCDRKTILGVIEHSHHNHDLTFGVEQNLVNCPLIIVM